MPRRRLQPPRGRSDSEEPDIVQASRPCTSCGTTIHRTPGKRGPIKTLCEQCKPSSTRGTCPTCGGPTPRTVRSNGSVAIALYCSEDCKPRCAVPDCGQPVRKRDWCGRHYARWHDKGDPEAPVKYEWAAEHRCLVCGRTPADGGWTSPHRRWCSANCQRLWYKHDGRVPDLIRCAKCGTEFSLVEATKHNSRRRSDTRFCRSCIRHARLRVTAADLAAMFGTRCGLCGKPVDMTLRSPHRMSPTVDHIDPRASGGTDEIDNLQLAHRGCNSSKRHNPKRPQQLRLPVT